MGFVAIAAAASMAAKTVGSVMSSISASHQAAYAAQVAENNATYQTYDAAAATQKGTIEAENRLEMAGRQQGAAKAGAAAKSIDATQGSAADVQGAIGTAGAIDAATLRDNARRAAFGHDLQAQAYESDATLQKHTANTAIPQALLGAATGVAGDYAKYSNAGIFGGGDTSSNPLDHNTDISSGIPSAQLNGFTQGGYQNPNYGSSS